MKKYRRYGRSSWKTLLKMLEHDYEKDFDSTVHWKTSTTQNEEESIMLVHSLRKRKQGVSG